jgi:hypothetical protein
MVQYYLFDCVLLQATEIVIFQHKSVSSCECTELWKIYNSNV